MKTIFILFFTSLLLASCNSNNQNSEKIHTETEKTTIQTTNEITTKAEQIQNSQKPTKIFTKADQFVVQIIGEREAWHKTLQIFRDKMVYKMNENISENERENFYFFPRLRFMSGMTALYGEYHIFHKELGLIQEEKMIFYPKNLENYEWNVITSIDGKFDCKIIETLDTEITKDTQFNTAHPEYMTCQ